jgi:hypothetical protein
MAALLLLDLLGMKARWKRSPQVADLAFESFRELVQEALEALPGQTKVQGGLESDGVALLFGQPFTAIRAGRQIYRSAFALGKRASDERFWIRGVIAPAAFNARLRTTAPLRKPFRHIEASQPGPSLLEALSIEQSGYKGMRLLIESSLVDDALRADLRIAMGRRSINPITRLKYSPPVPNYLDVLWMIPDHLSGSGEWFQLAKRMNRRLRWSGQDAMEFVQASATSLVFAECGAILARTAANAGVVWPAYF